MDLNQIQTPTFVVNTGQCRQNIQKIKHKADRDQVLFRPHFKTHQSVHIAGLFKEAGIKAICVSSVSMAKQFIQQGWKDITIAFPFNVREINRLKDLQLRARINILIDNPDTALILDHATELETGFFIEIDTGYHRSGIPAENIREISSLLNLVKNPQLKFKGFLSHFGNSYSASSVSEIKNIFKSGIKQLNLLKSQFIREYPEIIISVGDTPTASLVDDFSGVGEIRPGNFVYYDVFQYFLGSCLASEIACYVACPVVSLKKERQEAIIYGGGVHLSKESVATESGTNIYGLAGIIHSDFTISTLPGAVVSSLSQEHGIIRFENNFPDWAKPGALIGVLPVHSCLTANLMKDKTIFIDKNQQI